MAIGTILVVRLAMLEEDASLYVQTKSLKSINSTADRRWKRCGRGEDRLWRAQSSLLSRNQKSDAPLPTQLQVPNVVISLCTIDNGDDDISIKTDGVVDPDATPDPTADASRILITGCTILHGHGLSMGSVTTGGVHDVLAENCTFQNTENGLRIKSGRDRGGTTISTTNPNSFHVK